MKSGRFEVQQFKYFLLYFLLFFRPFIPPRQRHRFDDFIKENETAGHIEDNISLASQKNAVKMFVNHFCNI